MRITEPMTMATDLVLACLGALFAYRLWRDRPQSSRRSARLLAAAMASMALGAAAGGISHGLRLTVGETADAILWKVTVYSVGLMAFFFVASTALSSLRERARRLLLWLATAQLLGYWWWMLNHDAFLYVIYDYVPAMSIVLVIQLRELRRGRASAAWISAGVVLSFIGAAVQQSGLTLHRHFNHNDLYHVVQMVAVWLLYKGGRSLHDR